MKQKSADKWRSHINQQAVSGLSIKKYCEIHRLASSNFYAWRSKLNSQGPINQEVDSTDWVSIQNESLSMSQPIQALEMNLSLPNGMTLNVKLG